MSQIENLTGYPGLDVEKMVRLLKDEHFRLYQQALFQLEEESYEHTHAWKKGSLDEKRELEQQASEVKRMKRGLIEAGYTETEITTAFEIVTFHGHIYRSLLSEDSAE